MPHDFTWKGQSTYVFATLIEDLIFIPGTPLHLHLPCHPLQVATFWQIIPEF